jgi:hypothetical protein
LEDLGLFHIVDDVIHLVGCLEAHLADVVVAQLEGDGEDILEDCFSLVDLGEGVELVGDLISDSPLFGVFLED